MKKRLFFGVIGAMAMSLASCSSDDLDINVPQTVENDETRFVTVQISAPSDVKSRAFENGTENESYIDRLDFFFYDAAGTPTAQPVTMTLAQIKQDVEDGLSYFPATANPDGSNVTRIYTSVVAAQLTQGQNLPAQIICIVNGEDQALTELKGVSLADLIDKERTTFRTDSYFTMSNSVYYGQNVLTGQANQRLCATPINANTQLFSTREEAQQAVNDSQDDNADNDGALVDIYVERLAAKIGLTLDGSTVEPYKLTDAANNEVTLTFVPEFWTVNAVDKSEYLTKRYGVENEDGSVNYTPSYGQINQALTGGAVAPVWWNDPDNFRSYWGSSPAYFDNEYPNVSDDVNDLDGYTYDYGVNYYTYNNVVAQAGRSDDGGIGKQALAADATTHSFATGEGSGLTLGETTVTYSTGYIYTREATVSRYRINDIENSNPAAAAPSAVVVGKYTVEGATTEGGTFFIDRNNGIKGTYYGSTNAAKTALYSRMRLVFTNNGTTRAPMDRFTLMHPNKATREAANVNLAGRLVTLQLTEANLEGAALYYYQLNEDGTGSYEQITTANLKFVNAQLLSIGYMDMFAQGLGFYSVPVRHLNWNNAWYQNGVYDWASIQSGALGIVRNHVYNLTINKITGLATALRSPDQPIVPAKDETNQYIAMRLNVLAWNVVGNDWNVDL